MNKIAKLILTLILTATVGLVNAQKWQKSIDKINASYETGDYPKADKAIQKLKSKSIKKLGSPNKYQAMAIIKEAKNNVALGIFSNVDNLIRSGIEMSETVNQTNSPLDHGNILKECIDIMLLWEDYNRAGVYMNDAITTFEEAGILTEDLKSEFDVYKARILTGKGFYSEAIDLIDGQMSYYQTRAVTPSSDKNEDLKRKREFGYMMLQKSNALRLMGNYESSDSAFLYTTGWITKYLSKADLLYSWSQYLNAKLLEEQGLNVKPLAELYEKAYNNSLRRYSPAHYVNIKIQESLLKAYYKNDDNQKLRVVGKTFQTTLKKSFDRGSVNRLILETLKYDFDLDDQRIRKLENEVVQLLAKSVELPKHHPKRIELLEFAYKVSKLNKNYKGIQEYLDQILEIKANLYGDDSPEYHFTKLEMANYYVDYTNDFETPKAIYDESFTNLIKKEITFGHPDYVEILNHLATFYEETDQYEMASETLEEALLVARTKYTDDDVDYAKELEKIGNLQIKIGKYKEAEKNLEKAIDIFDLKKNAGSDSYKAVALITQAKLFTIQGEYDEAEYNIYKSEKLTRKGTLTIAGAGVEIEDDLADLYLNIGRFSEAEYILKQSLKDKKKRYGEDSRHLTNTYTLMGKLKLTVGEYSEAEQLARKAYNTNYDIFGAESSKIAPSMTLLAKTFTAIGDFDKAEQVLNDVIKIQSAQFGDNHVDIGKSMADLALVKYYNDEPINEVEPIFLKAEKIIGRNLGGSNPTYAEMLKNLAIVNIANDRFDLAFNYLDEAGRIWSSKIGRRNNVNSATVNILKGNIFYKRRKYGKAEGYYQDAKKIYERFFSTSHPEYVKVLSKLSKTYYMKDDKKRAKETIETVLENYEYFISEYFPSLSEREKAKFWNTIRTDYEFYNTLIISDLAKNKSLVGDLYNNALLTKGLLLSSQKKIRESIMNSGDEELKSTYMEWIDKKELLTYALSMSSDQLAQNGINTNVLSNEVELLEKELSKKSIVFNESSVTSDIKWEDIRNSLRENEVALEMTRFRHFHHTFTDSVIYAIFYLKPEKRSKPEIILIPNGKDLEQKYLKTYRNSIKYKVHDTYSYQQFWQPIVEKVGTLSSIYLSPDGVYNQINLEAIPIDREKYVIDNSNIILVSNTKDIFRTRSSTDTNRDAKVALMFGNPSFYLDTEPGKPVEGSGLTRATTSVVSQLPGTQKELEGLELLLNNKGWKTEEYTEENATEESIKKVNNPKIFHIATHGFFQNSDRKTADAGENESYLYDNPLLKTGLLLTGAGDILNQTKYNYNVDDGILTAYEAINLSLDQTDLVVLSACETGLGEVQAGEGVYGLQRSFLVAGAKSIVMSLFKVSDNATQELMVNFYEKWLETGNKRESFIQAKKEIRNKYKDPIYWGPFVMIGME
ncbi:MAG: CHAT domain-containing protein [bacterium]|nr:CHAT domain-containing protein [bacterium]